MITALDDPNLELLSCLELFKPMIEDSWEGIRAALQQGVSMDIIKEQLGVITENSSEDYWKRYSSYFSSAEALKEDAKHQRQWGMSIEPLFNDEIAQILSKHQDIDINWINDENVSWEICM